jgi:pilus assembly protein CpaE
MEPIRQVLLGLGLECSAEDCVTYEELPVRLGREPAELVLVVVAPGVAGASTVIRQTAARTKAVILAVGPTQDAQYILQTLQSGAREYLGEDRLRSDLETALEKLHLAGVVKHIQGTILGVVSATPGSGVSTVAGNLAFAWADQYPEGIALIELGRGAADVALSLDLNPPHTVEEVVQNWERLDATLLKQSLASHPGGVRVLAHKPEKLFVTPLDPVALRKTLLLLRTIYQGVVLDLGHLLEAEHQEALRLCDLVAVVVRLDVPALRQARGLVSLLEGYGVSRDRLRLIANRYGQKGQIPWKKAEESLGAKFAAYLPDEISKLNRALNQGQPVVRVAPGANIARRFHKLARLLNGKPNS